MVQSTSGFHVCSELNTWIDFMIVIDIYDDFTKAEEIIKKQKIPIGQMKMLKVKQWQIGLVVS